MLSKRIVKIISIVIIQVFLMMDAAWAIGPNARFSEAGAQEYLAPTLTINSGTIQATLLDITAREKTIQEIVEDAFKDRIESSLIELASDINDLRGQNVSGSGYERLIEDFYETTNNYLNLFVIAESQDPKIKYLKGLQAKIIDLESDIYFPSFGTSYSTRKLTEEKNQTKGEIIETALRYFSQKKKDEFFAGISKEEALTTPEIWSKLSPYLRRFSSETSIEIS